MEIVVPRAEHVQPLFSLYCETVAAAPHCLFLPTQERFRDQLLGAARAVPLFFPPRSQERFVVAEHGLPRGFTSVAHYKDWDGGEHRAITALFFDGDAAGHALIAACEQTAGAEPLLAFPATHGKSPVAEYNCGWNGLSDRIPNVARVLTRAGYTAYQRELHLAYDFARFPPEPLARFQLGQLGVKGGVSGRASPSPALSDPHDSAVDAPDRFGDVELSEDPDDRGRLWVRAIAGGRKVGDCVFSTLEQLTAEGARTGYIWGLGVEEGFQRRGIARALMARALGRLVALGCEACWLTTTADNWPAQSLYSSLGFVVLDCSASFRRSARR